MNRSSLCQAACDTGIEVFDATFQSDIDLYINDIDTLKCFITNEITNMDEIFLEKNNFNGDLFCWNTSSVTSMKVSAKQLRTNMCFFKNIFSIISHLLRFFVTSYSFTIFLENVL